MLLLLLLDNKLWDARKTFFRHLTSNYSTWALPTGGGGTWYRPPLRLYNIYIKPKRADGRDPSPPPLHDTKDLPPYYNNTVRRGLLTSRLQLRLASELRSVQQQ